MKHSPFGIGLILATSLATGALAMALTADQTKPKTAAKETVPATVHITGCLGREAAPAPAPATSKAPAPTYQLTHLTADDWKTAMGTSGTMLGATDLSTVKDLRLKANSGVDLKAHVDHKVELTGKLSESTKAANNMKGPVLQVSALKMVSPSCQ